jgi:hypothetical protein
MMDWSENSISSTSYKVACARCVHREIKKNLETTNESNRLLNPLCVLAAGRLFGGTIDMECSCCNAVALDRRKA